MADLPISIVVPLYRSEHLMDGLCSLLEELLHDFHRESEVLLVSDGDPELSHRHPSVGRLGVHWRLRTIILKRNFGQMVASTCGVQAAMSPVILVLDADTGCPIQLLKAIAADASTPGRAGYMDVVGTVDRRPMIRRLGSRAVAKLFKLGVPSVPAGNGSSVKAIDREMAERVLSDLRFPELLDVMILRTATEVTMYPYHSTRNENSSYTTLKLITLLVRMSLAMILIRLRFPPRPFNGSAYIYTIECPTGE